MWPSLSWWLSGTTLGSQGRQELWEFPQSRQFLRPCSSDKAQGHFDKPILNLFLVK